MKRKSHFEHRVATPEGPGTQVQGIEGLYLVF